MRHELEGRLQARRLAQHVTPERHGVLGRLAGELVHEALPGKDVVVGSDAPPKAGRHGGRFGAHVSDVYVRDVVGDVRRRVDGITVDAFLKRRRQPAGENGGACDLIFPGRHPPVLERRGDGVAKHWPVDVVLDVLLAPPHDLDRLAIKLLRHAHGLERHIRLEAPTEATADVVVVHRDLLERQPRQLGDGLLHPRDHLGAEP